MSRRSLAVRFRKVHAKVISRGRIPRKIVPWSNPASSGVLVTGTSPFWVTGNEASQIKILPHPSAIRSFCDITPTHAPPNALNSFALVGTDVSASGFWPNSEMLKCCPACIGYIFSSCGCLRRCFSTISVRKSSSGEELHSRSI